MSPEEYKKRALAGHLNINHKKIHNINHAGIAKNILSTCCHIDPLNIWNKEDLKYILHYMRKIHQKKEA